LCNRDCTLGTHSKEFLVALYNARQLFISRMYPVTEEFYDLFVGSCTIFVTDRESFKIIIVGDEFKCAGEFECHLLVRVDSLIEMACRLHTNMAEHIK